MEGNKSNQEMHGLCKEGCGFYGSSANEGFCSQCYKKRLRRWLQMNEPSTPTTPTTTTLTSLASSITPAIASTTIPSISASSSTSTPSASAIPITISAATPILNVTATSTVLPTTTATSTTRAIISSSVDRVECGGGDDEILMCTEDSSIARCRMAGNKRQDGRQHCGGGAYDEETLLENDNTLDNKNIEHSEIKNIENSENKISKNIGKFDIKSIESVENINSKNRENVENGGSATNNHKDDEGSDQEASCNFRDSPLKGLPSLDCPNEELGEGVGGEALPTVEEHSEGEAKKKRRCFKCNKKIGLTGFGCRCGGVFCGQHRYTDTHQCSFDYKSLGKQEVEKNNPRVAFEKVAKI